jgi:predicted nucleic acid-binding protein
MNKMRKIVMNTSPLVWLSRIDEVNLLKELYDVIYTTPLVLEELKEWESELNNDAKSLLRELIIPDEIKDNKKSFDRCVRRRKRRLKRVGINFDDIPDLEVLVTCQSFSDADTILLADKFAEDAFGRYYNVEVKDVTELYKVAIERDIFDVEKAKEYLNKLLEKKYRDPFVKKLMETL